MKRILLFLLLISAPVMAAEKPITNLSDYFEYLPNAVHTNWTPYKANKDYEVTVQFKIKKNGEVSDINVTESTNQRANNSVLDAVKKGAPYKPLPASFKQDSVKTQMELKYISQP